MEKEIKSKLIYVLNIGRTDPPEKHKIDGNSGILLSDLIELLKKYDAEELKNEIIKIWS